MAMQTMINAQGSTFMAGLSVAGRITGCSNIAVTALSSAATTFSGQNFGAQNIERLKKGYIKIPAVSSMITLAFGLFFITVRMPILRIFSTDADVLMYASRYLFTEMEGRHSTEAFPLNGRYPRIHSTASRKSAM